jgi:hypothetical protein
MTNGVVKTEAFVGWPSDPQSNSPGGSVKAEGLGDGFNFDETRT